MNQRIQKHYSNIAHNYDALWTYNPDFIKFVGKILLKN